MKAYQYSLGKPRARKSDEKQLHMGTTIYVINADGSSKRYPVRLPQVEDAVQHEVVFEHQHVLLQERQQEDRMQRQGPHADAYDVRSMRSGQSETIA